jgi:hypothetical protein
VPPEGSTHDAPLTHDVVWHDGFAVSGALVAGSALAHPMRIIATIAKRTAEGGYHRRIVRARLALLFALLITFGCARTHAPVLLVTQWTFAAPDIAARQVTLPTHLPLPDQKLHYSLTTRVTLPPDMVNQPLTLALVRSPAIAELRVNGIVATALDADVTTRYRVSGGQRWTLPKTAEPTLDLTLDLDHNFTQSAWIDTVPRLSATDHGDDTFLLIHTFNSATALFGMSLVVASGLSYLLIFLLDRSRRAYAWFVVEAIGGIAFPAYASGITQPFFGTRDAIVMGAQLMLGAIAAVAFVRVYFGLGFPGRRVLTAWGAVAVIALLTGGPFSTRWFAPLVALTVGVSAWMQIALCIKLWRQRPRPRNVILVTLAWPIAGILGTIEILWWLGLGSPFQGFQGGSAAISIVAFLRIAALSREHVRSLRKTDHLLAAQAARVAEVERLNEELRRQIASRSAQLADALARIGARHSGVVILDVGDTVAGRYRIVRPIASGGMGSVYEVVRLKDSVSFALKVLHGRNEPLALARFAREAQIAAQIDHPNVVAIVDMDVDADGYVFLVMELVRGTTLSELRDRFGDLGFARPVLRQIAEGLAAIHDRGIVHRDLKPANVLIVDPDGQPHAKITDFGVAMLDDKDSSRDEATVDDRARSQPDDSTAVEAPPPRISSTPLTHTGVVVGTPMYMAPELLGGARYAKPAADVFGLGVLAFLLLTGAHPFPERRDSMNDVREAPPSSSKRADLPADLAAIVDAALALDPAKRPTARDFARAL